MREAEVQSEGDGSSMVTLGLAPLAGQVVPALRLARSAGSVLFDFEGLRAFKARLRPTRWRPSHLVYPPEQGAVRTLLDVLEAFARGHLLTFGLRTLLRGPTIVVRLLAALLVPWTALLARRRRRGTSPRRGCAGPGWPSTSCSPRRCSGSRCAGATGSRASSSPRWARTRLLTLGEVLAWNLPRLRGSRTR